MLRLVPDRRATTRRARPCDCRDRRAAAWATRAGLGGPPAPAPRALRLVLLLFLTACATHAAPPALPASETAPFVARQPALQGTWAGDYAGATYRRSGALTLVIGPQHAAEDSLYLGGVPTHDPRWDPPPTRRSTAERPAGGGDDGTMTVGLRLTRRAVSPDGSVAFAAEPYWDPGCGCTVTLTFTGHLAADTLRGRFHARAAATQVPDTRTRWRVVRRAPAAPGR
jgi:hypothetical protein